MDDRNTGSVPSVAGSSGVQIPLWTIGTFDAKYTDGGRMRVQIPLWTIGTERRQSTMSGWRWFRFLYGR